MPAKQDVTLDPCNECPFRKTSLKGWLGPHSGSAEIVTGVMADARFPCHVDANHMHERLCDELPDIERKRLFLGAAAMAMPCVGALVFMNHHCKLSRDIEIVIMQRAAGKRDDVFKNLKEMQKHHGK